jgi:hypothetical protein
MLREPQHVVNTPSAHYVPERPPLQLQEVGFHVSRLVVACTGHQLRNH